MPEGGLIVASDAERTASVGTIRPNTSSAASDVTPLRGYGLYVGTFHRGTPIERHEESHDLLDLREITTYGFGYVYPVEEESEVRTALEAFVAEISPRQEAPKASFHSTIPREISPEAERHLIGYRQVIDKVCSLAEEEARSRGISVTKIDVRPTWSHESDECTGVVIDAEVKASAEERNRYWDAMCEGLNQLENSASPEERQFLTNEVFFVVSRG